MRENIRRFIDDSKSISNVDSLEAQYIPISPKKGGGEILFVNCFVSGREIKSLSWLRGLATKIAQLFLTRVGQNSVCISLLKCNSEGNIRLYRISLDKANISRVGEESIQSVGVMEHSRDFEIIEAMKHEAH